MAQKLRDDKIGTLSHSAGNITMAASPSSPAYLTIGGQQFKITSNLVVALPAMSANTRYQVFAVQAAGVVSLVISTNENSVGPAGYTRWKLVGSLMANGLASVAFGSFLTIEGVPTSLTSWIGDFTINATTSAPTKGTGLVVNRLVIDRIGNKAVVKMEYRHTIAGANGSGDYLFGNPTNLLTDLTNVTPYTTVEGFNSSFLNNNGQGSCQGGNGANQFFGIAVVYDANYIRFAAGDDSSNTQGFIGSAGYQLGTATVYYVADYVLEISGWSSKPIKDL